MSQVQSDHPRLGFENQKGVQSGFLHWLLYGYFLSIVWEKSPREPKSTKAHHLEKRSSDKTIVNIDLIGCISFVFGVVVGDGFEPSKA